MTYVLNMWNTYVLTISLLAIHDKTTTNKWAYERSHKSLNSYSLFEYNKIYPNTNSWKILQEESLWQVDFDNLYFWNTLNKTHQNIFVWNRNNRLHTVRTYVFHMLRTYVMFLCNWLILWQNALYLYLGRFMMCLNTSRNYVLRSSIEAFKSVQENKLIVQIH